MARLQAAIPWENASKAVTRRKELADYFSAVPRSLLLRVWLRYRLDYQMFGYSINTALKLGGHQSVSPAALAHLAARNT